MSLFSQIGMLGIGLSGILFGLALSYIAKEELASGKKYFLFLKSLFYVIFTLMAGYYLWDKNDLISVTLLLLLVIGLVLTYKLPTKHYTWIGVYGITIACYLLVSVPDAKPIMVVLMFLYGLPTGTLLRTR